MIARLTDGLRWWLRELNGCLPGALRLNASPSLELDLAKPLPDHLGKRSNRLATIRLAPAQVLRPRVVLPITSADSLRETLIHEMDRHTPFSASEVLFDYQVLGSDGDLERIEVQMEVARRPDVEAASELALDLGLLPQRVTGPSAGDLGPEINLLPAELRRAPGRFLPRAAMVLAVIALTACAATLGAWIDHQQRRLSLLETHATALRGEAAKISELTRQSDDLRALAMIPIERRRTIAPVLSVLEEVTRLLPDDHHAISFSIRKGEVQIAGQSSDASEIIGLLEGSEMLSNARFAAPITSDPRSGLDRFNAIATLSGWGEPD